MSTAVIKRFGNRSAMGMVILPLPQPRSRRVVVGLSFVISAIASRICWC